MIAHAKELRTLNSGVLPRRTAAQDPPFLKRRLSGADSRRVSLIEAQSQPGSIGSYPDLQREISRVLAVPVQMAYQG